MSAVFLYCWYISGKVFRFTTLMKCDCLLASWFVFKVKGIVYTQNKIPLFAYPFVPLCSTKHCILKTAWVTTDQNDLSDLMI